MYAPNTPGDRKEFFTSITEHFVSSSPLIICGDFNFVENENLDKLSDSKRLFSSCPTFINIAKKYNLCDIFRKMFPKKKVFSWQCNNVACRLDRFYLISSLSESVSDCNYLPCPFSDHDFVYISFNVGESISVGKSYWKLNNSILKEEDFIISFRYYWKIISRTDKMALIWWDKMKLLIKDLIVLFEM